MFNIISNIAKDKLLHFFWGAVISFCLILAFNITGIILSLVIPAIKELYYDKYLGKGNCDIYDYIYSVIPTIMIVIIKYI